MNVRKIYRERTEKIEKNLAKGRTTSHKNRKDELKQDVKDLQSMGLLKGIDKDTKPEEILNKIKKADKVDDTVEYSGTDAMEIKSKKEHTIGEKVLAILYMEAFQREHEGEMKPRYTLIGTWLRPNEPNHANNLMRWWKDRDEILKQKNAIIEYTTNIVQLSVSTELIRMSEASHRIDYDSMSNKDFTQHYAMLLNRHRLMSNLSTQNVEHKHEGGVNLVMPKE